MIQLPDFDKSFDYENDFYLSCDPSRISKILAHYELYKKVLNIPGTIVECGVFKGASLARFAMFRELFENSFSKKIIGFDAFGEFPNTDFSEDKELRQHFIDVAGQEGISKKQLYDVLENKGVNNQIELIEGDILQTVPEYLNKNPHLKISLLNLDTDIYEPAVTILENLYPRISIGGILIVDDYGVFAGETKAVDDFFKDKNIQINKFPFAKTPSFIIKKEG